jgi:hypothetical protein
MAISTTPSTASSGAGAGDDDTQWHVWGLGRYPKSEIVFFVQVFLIYIVVITSIVNLTLNKDEGKLWTALLSSSLGYILPNPSLKKMPKQIVHQQQQQQQSTTHHGTTS